MNLSPIDLRIVAVYLVAIASVGFVVKKRATKKLDSYYLSGRNVPWWMLGLSGCSNTDLIIKTERIPGPGESPARRCFPGDEVIIQDGTLSVCQTNDGTP